MPEYKLDISYNRKGTVQLHVFDLDDDEIDGSLETCSVGDELGSHALREAWNEFMTPPTATEMLRQERERDKIHMEEKYFGDDEE